MTQIGQGGTIRLDSTWTDGAGNLVNPTTPLADIVNPSSVTVVTDAVPATTGVGLFYYDFAVPLAAPLGTWTIHWTGVINGAAVSADEAFTVVAAGTVTFPTAASWVTGASLASDKRLDDADMPAEVTFDMCAEGATEYLYKRTGRRFRIHTVTVRPNVNTCGCAIDECSGNTELELPGPVVADSVVVVIGGVTLSPSAYRVYDRRLLVRQDGGSWAVCQHLSTPIGAESMEITLSYGEAPDMDLVLACRELAIHVALALSGKQSKIPARATTVSRKGVSINLMRGRHSTGIPLVDDAIEGSNPFGLTGRGSVTSPDTIRLSST